MRRRNFTEMDRLDIRAAVAARQYWSDIEVAKRYGVSRQTLALVAHLPPQVFFEIREAKKYQKSLSAKALAKQFGCSPATIHKMACETSIAPPSAR